METQKKKNTNLKQLISLSLQNLTLTFTIQLILVKDPRQYTAKRSMCDFQCAINTLVLFVKEQRLQPANQVTIFGICE